MDCEKFFVEDAVRAAIVELKIEWMYPTPSGISYIAAALDGGIVLRCDMSEAFFGRRYVLAHPEFSAVPRGQMMPTVTPTMTLDENGAVHRVGWEQVR